MSLTCAVVLTTVYDSDILDGYLDNFKQYGHLDNVQIIVVPDRKTPSAVLSRCLSLSKKGLRATCPTLQEQEEFLKKLGKFSKLVPYNSDNRRNIGFLMALEQGVDFLISIDDDNFCLPNNDFFLEHSIVCRDEHSFTIADSSSGWINICDMLEMEPSYHVYPRGFPYKRRQQSENVNYTSGQGIVHLNAGLWLSEPDLDGMTWLVAPVRAKSFKGKSVVLGNKTWSPINTQNTAVHREVIPSYYFIRMGYPIAGMVIDRYGDIFSGYFSQTCIRHLGYRVRIGTPLVEHRRNSHNYLQDATKELACIWVLEDLTEWLQEAKLEGNTYSDTYMSLSYAIDDVVEHFSGFIWTDATRGYLHQVVYCMREWLNACRLIG